MFSLGVQPAAEQLAGRQRHGYEMGAMFEKPMHSIVQPAAERLAGRQRHGYERHVRRTASAFNQPLNDWRVDNVRLWLEMFPLRLGVQPAAGRLAASTTPTNKMFRKPWPSTNR